MAHPSKPLVLSIDEEGQSILWHCQDTIMASSPAVMKDIAEFTQLSSVEWANDGINALRQFFLYCC